MTDYTARNVLLKDSSGNYLIPYTEKADLSLGNLNSAGKAYVAIKGYDSTATYSLNEVVMTVVSGSVLFYRSLADNNTASLSDTTKWSEVSFGSGANIDLSNLSATGQAVIDGKADVDAGNFDATGKSVLSGLPMPHSGKQLTLLASGGTYTAPSNGWFGVYAATNGGAWIKLASNVTGINDVYRNYSSGNTDAACLLLPVAKGQVVTYTYGGTFYNNQNYIYFIKAQGGN